MVPTLSSIVWAVCLLPAAAPAPAFPSYLYRDEVAGDGAVCCRAAPYCPREGDLVLFDHGSRWWHCLEAIAGTNPPDHSGIVVRRPDGNLALLEVGPNRVFRVFLLDVPRRLHSYRGSIYVRRLKHPLSPEQSAQLTQFAVAQEGKRYALVRFALQITPCRARGWLRSKVFGRTYINRSSWICSELTMAAAAVAGLIDPDRVLANTVYPGDLADDRQLDLSDAWEPPMPWGGLPPRPDGRRPLAEEWMVSPRYP